MEKTRLPYDPPEIEVILLEWDTILTSGEDSCTGEIPLPRVD